MWDNVISNPCIVAEFGSDARRWMSSFLTPWTTFINRVGFENPKFGYIT